MSDHEQESKDPGKVPTISSLRVDNFFLIERAGKAEAELTRLRAQQTVVRDALVPIITRGASQCSPEHDGLSPVEITLNCAEFRTIAVALATLDVPPEKL